MLRDILSLGDKIDVKLLDRNGRPVHNSKTYVSQLIDFVDFDVIHIASPIDQGRTIILNAGEYYNLCFYSNKSLYQCNCQILSNHKENNTVIAVVRIITNLEKYQRRQYYRLECILDIDYHVITMEDEISDNKLKTKDFRNPEERNNYIKRLDEANKEWIQASVTDISGGGAKFNSGIQHSHGDKLRLKLGFITTIDNKKLTLSADVVTSNRIMNRTGLYEHRVAFNDIVQKDRESIIRYIFEQERRLRRNEKN